MYAVEFMVRIEKGMIEIPTQYRDKLKGMVKVIILSEEGESSPNMIDQLLERPLKTKRFKPLSRTNIYD